MIAWIGALLLCGAPFFINTLAGKAAAIVGLAILGIQAYKLRAFNIAFCNAVGIMGYIYSILQGI